MNNMSGDDVFEFNSEDTDEFDFEEKASKKGFRKRVEAWDEQEEIRHQVNIELGEENLEGQKERLQEELEMSKEEAELTFDLMKAYVDVKNKSLDKNWSEDVQEGIANLLIAMVIEEKKQINESRNEILGRNMEVGFEDNENLSRSPSWEEEIKHLMNLEEEIKNLKNEIEDLKGDNNY